MALFKVPKKSKADKLATLSAQQRRQVEEIEAEAIANFEGGLDELESALGMLHIGHHFGWKVLYVIHSKRTIRKYEGVLNIRVRDIFPETGPSSYRSNGYRLISTLSNFWKALGETKIENRREIAK